MNKNYTFKNLLVTDEFTGYWKVNILVDGWGTGDEPALQILIWADDVNPEKTLQIYTSIIQGSAHVENNFNEGNLIATENLAEALKGAVKYVRKLPLDDLLEKAKEHDSVFYEVLTLGENVWVNTDEDGIETSITYETKQEAIDALIDFFEGCKDSIEKGLMSSLPDPENFEIQKVKGETTELVSFDKSELIDE